MWLNWEIELSVVSIAVERDTMFPDNVSKLEHVDGEKERA